MIDVIIDHLHDDIQSLKACSLVCKTWTRSARFHLFSTLTVSRLGAIKRLLRSAPAVISSIRHLHLRNQLWGIILPLLVGFESIKSLTLTGVSIDRMGADVLSGLCYNFSAAVVVRLKDVEFDSSAQLFDFICAFPRLQRLAISFIGTSDEFESDLPPPTAFSLSPHLYDLELDGACMDPVLDWLLSLPDRPALRAVGLRPTYFNNTITKLLLALEDSLETFLISTTIADGTCVIFPNLIDTSYKVRTALAVGPTPQRTLTLPSN